MKKATVFAFAALFAFTVPTAFAAEAAVHKGRGTVKSVDVEGRKVNLSHEAITSLGWPAMTMDFRARDKTVLEAVKPGARVEFDLAQDGSKGYVITRMVPAR